MSEPDFLQRLRAANTSRVVRWHPPGTEEWNLADWSNAFQGEAGEAGNVVKKIRRAQTRTGPQTMEDVPALLDALDEEIADTVTYADLLQWKANELRARLGLRPSTLEGAITQKFDVVSFREGFPERLGR